MIARRGSGRISIATAPGRSCVVSGPLALVQATDLRQLEPPFWSITDDTEAVDLGTAGALSKLTPTRRDRIGICTIASPTIRGLVDELPSPNVEMICALISSGLLTRRLSVSGIGIFYPSQEGDC